ncbi:FAD:protein FMN transferase [Verrucomicrobiaceae bacterium 5K15]|uniref:FAD:protein FMN transferase n=1 Tax=Oceaniferula flava TaxID=2800421 RepID=A0AAE2V8H6_9BACT|nr:FAD:protein FMN transferase [Oceaniferula flavus]MBK1855567.1 FAD:protein FMN transferase [Oceaniferula flavus]MBM1136873.1 FAD:protein FMN transferase [Oceaniferula flavus]
MTARSIIACLLSLSPITSVSLAAEPVALERYHFQSALMGTKFQIVLYSDDAGSAKKAADAAFELGQKVEDACSDYDPRSELMALMKPPATQQVSPLLADVLSKSLAIAQETDGGFDPTLGGHSWNWRRARTRGKLPTAQAIAAAQAISGWRNLTIDAQGRVTKGLPGMKLDLGGIAKGYAADLMLEELKRRGIRIATVAAGGDVRLGDPPPGQQGWRVGLKTLGSEPAKARAFIIVSNCAVSTSGDLHQFSVIDGKRYSHIVDPATGLGLTQRISATVVAPTATRSDALATASCVSDRFRALLLANKRAEKALIITLDKAGRPQQRRSADFPNIHTAP